MHIAFDAKRFFHNSSGLGNYARDLVRIMATHYPNNEYGLYTSKATNKGNNITALPNVHIHLPETNFPLWRQLQMGKAAQNNNAKVIHGTSGELPRLWNKKPIKKVVSICDVIFERYPQYYSAIDRKIHFNKFKHACKIADEVIAISQQTKQDCIEYLGVPEKKVKVIYLACHPAMQVMPEASFVKATTIKYNLPDNFILNVGTIEERKNVLNIVKAIYKTNIILVVVGRKTKYYNEVLNYIIKHKMQQQVMFLENVSMEELSVIYRQASMLVYPSKFEGFGLPIAEALFTGTPVVTTYNSCFPEVAGAHSAFVNPESSEDIAEKINAIWTNTALQNEMIKHGLVHAQQFMDKPIARQWAQVYNLI